MLCVTLNITGRRLLHVCFALPFVIVNLTTYSQHNLLRYVGERACGGCKDKDVSSDSDKFDAGYFPFSFWHSSGPLCAPAILQVDSYFLNQLMLHKRYVIAATGKVKGAIVTYDKIMSSRNCCCQGLAFLYAVACNQYISASVIVQRELPLFAATLNFPCKNDQRHFHARIHQNACAQS